LSNREWPSWWDWELELSPHLLKRMIDRQFSEVDLRRMLEHAVGLRQDVVEGRWAVQAWNLKQPWEVIIEPDFAANVIVVVTAYPLR
jgi:hypothetical protein